MYHMYQKYISPCEVSVALKNDPDNNPQINWTMCYNTALFCDPSSAAQILLIILDMTIITSSHIPKPVQGE